MEMTGSIRVPAERERVWAALNDPEILQQCVPGCEMIERTGANEFKAAVRAKVGPVNARFTGTITLTDLNPPQSYTITGQGSGGAAGFAKGGAEVRLEADGPSATKLDYAVKAQVGGKLMQIGSRLIDATARKYADEFFTKFNEVVGGPQESATADVETPVSAAAQPAETPKPPIAIWLGAAAAAAITILVIMLLAG